MLFSWTSLAIPKSVTLHFSPSPTNTLRAARSQWIIYDKTKQVIGIVMSLESPGELTKWNLEWKFMTHFRNMYKSENSPTKYSLLVSMTNTSFHRRLAMQTSSAALTSDLYVVRYPGLWSNCHLIHCSFLGIPADLHVEHIQSTPSVGLLQDR